MEAEEKMMESQDETPERAIEEAMAELEIDPKNSAAAASVSEAGDACANAGGQSEQAEPRSAQGAVSKTPVDTWLECIAEWYPDRHSQAYFLPPFHFRRTQYKVVEVAGQSALLPVPPLKRFAKDPEQHYPHPKAKRFKTSQSLPLQGSVFSQPEGEPAPIRRYIETDALDDDATERVLGCLQAYFKDFPEGMVVISRLEFRKYLQGCHVTSPVTTAVNAAAYAGLPQPSQMPQNYKDRESDMLIIHRVAGLIACEMKSVGGDVQKISDLNAAVMKKAQENADQVNVVEEVLRGLLTDMAPVTVLKTLIFPNITSSQLEEALLDPGLLENVCNCLGAKDRQEAVSLCLCKDQMPTMAELHNRDSAPEAFRKSQSLTAFSTWWKNVTSRSNRHASVPAAVAVYDELLARFCGPATTIDVPTMTVPRKALKKKGSVPAMKTMKTRAQAVAETGLIMSLLTLYPEQVRLLQDSNLQVIHLYGPPGTGKTVILVLKACQWLGQGKPVHVVSLSDESRCISYLIQRQLEHIHGSTSDIHLHVIKSPYKQSDIDKLASAATAGELYVIADEVIPVKGKSQNPSSHEHTKFDSFITSLKKKVPTLHLWCASIRKLANNPQDWMIQEKLINPLRSPPVVNREISRSSLMTSTETIPPYCVRPVSAPTDGPPIKWLKHSKEPGHNSGQPMNCGACGEAIEKFLGELGVGKNYPDPLQCKDVFILCPNPRDLTGDKEGIVSVLRARGNKVRVLRREDGRKDFGDALKEYRDVALAARNEIIVTDYKTVSGLERRIVIGMGTQLQGEEMANRLLAMSRCTAQLVWIGNPTKF